MSFFRSITPIGEIASLNVGSRPAARKNSGRIQDLRAIPWVFGWSQCRLNIPGWFGAGSAFEAFATDPDRAATLVEMHDRWPFFKAMLNNMGMVLAKTDLGLGRMYAEALVHDQVAREEIFGLIEREHALTCAWHARLTGSDNPLVDNPALGAEHPQSVPLPRSPARACRSSCCDATDRATPTNWWNAASS